MSEENEWKVRAKALSDAAWNAINEANAGVRIIDATTPVGKMSELLLEMATHLGAAGRVIDGLKREVSEERERCARIATSGCLVPPDGGAPTETERQMCDTIAAAIRNPSH